LGGDAGNHGDALRSIAMLTVGAYVIELIARQFFVRACVIELDGGRLSLTSVVWVPWSILMRAVVIGLGCELLFWMMLPTLLLSPLFMLYAAVASASVMTSEAGLFGTIKRISTVARPLPLLILGMGFLLAIPILMINLHLIVRLGLWMAGGLAGFDIGYWQAVFNPSSVLYWLLIFVGATLVLQPFWFAAAVVEVRQARSRRTGEDLQQWFGELVKRQVL
jgi:hypothetical protein